MAKSRILIIFPMDETLFRYHLKDVIVGKIYFLLVRIKIKNMELEIRRRESTGSGPNTYVETETLAKFELMDGAPVRGITIFPLNFFQKKTSYSGKLVVTYSAHNCLNGNLYVSIVWCPLRHVQCIF